MHRSGCDKEKIAAVSFCCQLQALILVDREGVPVRHPMGYMDGRAVPQFENNFATGVPRIENLNALKLLQALYITGGAKSSVLCQIMADILGRQIEVPRAPQNAGAAGAAIVCGLGLGAIASVGDAKSLVDIGSVHEPNGEVWETYTKMFTVFKQLYDNNKKMFWALNQR